MTYMLRGVLIVACCLLMAGSVSAQEYHLQKADSLFKAGKYTESYDLYEALFAQRKYSPAMLLKMAYIREGLNAYDDALYYLNLYYMITSDPEALRKMNELAEKFHLEGYSDEATAQALTLYTRYHTEIAFALAGVCLFFFGLAVYLWRRKRPVIPPMIPMVLFLLILFAHVNLSGRLESVIASQPQTYLMSEPSAGGEVLDVIGEGNKLFVIGKQDVWFKVEWQNREVFVRANQVRELKL